MLDLVLEIDHILTGKTYFQMERHRVRITICQKRLTENLISLSLFFQLQNFIGEYY